MPDSFSRLLALAARHAGRTLPLAGPRVAIHSGCKPTTPVPTLYEPMLCVVLQGAKQVMIGDRVLRYDPASYFVATLELPATGCIVEASAARPYIAVSMALNRATLADLLCAVPETPSAGLAGFGVSAMTPELLDPWLRMLGLFEAPQDAPVLAPMLEREILYRLLQGPQGDIARQAARGDGRLAQIRSAIGWIRENFDRPLRIEELAARAGMSAASFHRHFKAATAMSPLQYQKALRLQEARRLLVSNGEASRAAYRVGYESASQFSREYARMFGHPPARDAARLRESRGAEELAA